jgi:hypothetical protein
MIVLTGNGRLPSGRSYPLATHRKEAVFYRNRFAAVGNAVWLPRQVSFVALSRNPKQLQKRRFACLAESSPAPFPAEARRLPVLIFHTPQLAGVGVFCSLSRKFERADRGARLRCAGCCVEAAMRFSPAALRWASQVSPFGKVGVACLRLLGVVAQGS